MTSAQAELPRQQTSSTGNRPAPIRRRGNPQQGQTLELLGHAVEYLVDSRVFLTGSETTRANQQAVHILKEASRRVFADCAEIQPFRRRVTNWLTGVKRPVQQGDETR